MAKGSDPKPKEKTAAEKLAAEEAAAKLAAEEAAKKKAAEGTDDDPPKKTEKSYSKADVDAQVKKAVDEALKKEKDEQDLSDLEKANKRIAEMEGENRIRDAKEGFVAALVKEGSNSPELMWNAKKGDLEFDDAGKVKNLDSLIKDLQTDYPDSFGEKKPEGGADGGKGQKGDETTLTKEKLEKMSPAEINELDWNEVSKVMAAD